VRWKLIRRNSEPRVRYCGVFKSRADNKFGEFNFFKFYIDEENTLLGVKKAKIGRQSPRTEFGAQNQYGRVIYPSIGKFIGVRKKNLRPKSV
jgi:hypothetical protein